MKKLLLIAFAFSAAAAFADTLTVTDVSARQRWPWNGLVDVDFKIGGDSVADLFKVEVHAAYAGGTKKVIGRTYLEEPLRGPGWNRLTWDFGADCPETKADDLQVAVVATPISRAQLDAQDVYMVIDLSSGPDSTRYPVRYTTTAPTLVPTNDLVACAADPNRTTKLWLKRVKANTYPFHDTSKGDPWFNVHLSPYYIGMFELTQKQWALVMDAWPSKFTNETYRAARPVEQINYEDVIGHNNWPNDRTVSANSFVGKMRARTGLATFNLPTEAQWECACRSGSKESYISGLKFRYAKTVAKPESQLDYNEDPTSGTALVGSYGSNYWGFYDFYGNVMEMCLDAYLADASLKTYYGDADPVEDPVGPPTNSTARYHATRGGGWYNNDYCNNYSRDYGSNPKITGTRSSVIGFRVAVSPEWK